MFTYDADGNLLTEDAEPAANASYRGGMAFNPETGALYIGGSGGYVNNGLDLDATGRVKYATSGAIAAYHHGWPLTALGEALMQNDAANPSAAPFINGAFINGSGIFVIGASGGTWSPSALFASSEVGVWYDPSDFDTMWKDTAGTTPVTAVDDLVARIDDKSGNGFHATQATEANRPVLKQDGNGNYYLLFDGVNDFLATASMDLTGTSIVTTFKGVTNNNTSVGMIESFGSNPLTVNGTFGTYTRVSNDGDYALAVRGTAHYYARTSGASIPRTSVLYTFHDVTAADVNSVAARVNAANASLTFVAGGTPSGTVFSTQTLTIGIRPDGSFPLSGGIYSLIVRGASSTSDEIDSAEAWVNGKTEAY
jgi:hypothetical protein